MLNRVTKWTASLTVLIPEPERRRRRFTRSGAAPRVAPLNGHGDESFRDWRIPVAWLTLCVVWSSTWLVIKIGLRDLPPVSFVACDSSSRSWFCSPFRSVATRLLPRRRADYFVLGFTGLLMFAVNYALLFWAELHVSSGLAAVIQASIPIFGMIFAHWMLPDEPLRWQRLSGALVAIFGVGAHLRSTAQLQRLARFSRRARDHDWRGERGVFQCPA